MYDRGHSKGQALAEGESRSVPSSAAPAPSRQFWLPSVLSPQHTVNETTDQSRQRGTKPLTQDTCSVATTISYTDLRENLEKGVCQTQPPDTAPSLLKRAQALSVQSFGAGPAKHLAKNRPAQALVCRAGLGTQLAPRAAG